MPQLPGVYTAKKKNGSIYYRSSVTYRAKHISLGSYDTEQAAHAAYLLAGKILQDTAVTLNQYLPDSVLLFEKWVCLINFRDNGIYFSNPIYIRPIFSFLTVMTYSSMRTIKYPAAAATILSPTMACSSIS